MSKKNINDLPLKFGKHKGATPNEVLEIEPSYLLWMMKTFKYGVPFDTTLMDNVLRVTMLNKLSFQEIRECLDSKYYE